MSGLILPGRTAPAPTGLAMETRQRNHIENVVVNDPIDERTRAESARLRALYRGATHRSGPPTFAYNCHGLTFASRRATIDSPTVVTKIINEDGYRLLGEAKEIARGGQAANVPVEPGDIVLYFDEGNDVSHSGIVVEVPKDTMVFNPKILSKWGALHEVVHSLYDCPYNDGRVYFYRVIP